MAEADELAVSGEYALTLEQRRAIMHSDFVVQHITALANLMLGSIEQDQHFKVVPRTDPSTSPARPRVYVAPADSTGVHLELTDSVILKAAAAMQA